MDDLQIRKRKRKIREFLEEGILQDEIKKIAFSGKEEDLYVLRYLVQFYFKLLEEVNLSEFYDEFLTKKETSK